MCNYNRPNKAKERIGEKLMMKCGLECTIIEYKDSKHITVQFETGEIVPRRSYALFTKGEIHPRKVSGSQNWRRTYVVANGKIIREAAERNKK